MNTIPQDLAGYQNIITGIIQSGDIVVIGTTRDKMWAPESWFGAPVEHCCQDIYRKMDVPRHEGETNWYAGDIKWINEPNKAKTNDEGKPPLAMLPWGGLRRVAMVQAGGHKKYKDYHNYRKGMEVSRNISCAIRHLADYMDGLDIDKESGECNLAHAATRILFAIQNLVDGRFKKQ